MGQPGRLVCSPELSMSSNIFLLWKQNALITFFSYSLNNEQRFIIKAGTIMRSRQGFAASTQAASKLISHPLYDKSTIEYDIALIKLKNPIPYNEYTRPVCLHDAAKDLSQFLECYTTGWGIKSKGNFVNHFISCKLLFILFDNKFSF